PCAGNDFVAISAGGWHNLALKQDASIVAWGRNDYGQADPCAGNDFAAISAGGRHSLALKYDGSIAAWGDNNCGQADPCAGNDFVAISAGGWHNLALKQDASIVAWGRNDYGQADPCEGNDFAAISAGGWHSLALKQDGSIVAWGRNDYGQASPPEGNNFVAIAAGEYHSLALKRDGLIVAWGRNDYGQADPCAGYSFVAISAGEYHGLAIMQLNDYHVSITKCTVTAGSKKGTDSIIVSGKMDATTDEMSDVDANEIRITVDSADMVNPCVQVFSINSKTFKKDIYTYSGTDKNGLRKSFKYTLKTGKFTFSAAKVALLGLGCPGTLQIKIGDSISTAKMSEAIVNGPKTPIPIKLMMGVRDVLRVDKCTVKHGIKPSTDLLTVKGAFAVKNPDVNMPNRVSEGLVITLGTQIFTIPKGNLKPGKGIFTCSNAKITGGIAAANFNFNTCAFTLTIKNADIDETALSFGDVDLGIAFAGFNEVVQVSFPIII
ncbi:MAG: hypothetical protein WAK60_10190, partial [Sedimentisphaerales bacterium]